MIENTERIATRDGEMEAYSFRPEEDGAFPAVILYMDAPGIREELYDFCRRIAGEGYFALLPDMYYRLGKLRFDAKDLAEGSPGRERMFEAMNSLNNGVVMSDTRGMLDFLGSHPNVKAGAKGCIGYCMCGQYVVSAAGTFPEDFGAVASLYGVGIVTDKEDSPHLLVKKVQGELYFGFASDDPYVPEDVVSTLQRELDAHGVKHRLDIWPDTHHGFCFPGRPVYVEDAAEKVWDIVFEMYARALG